MSVRIGSAPKPPVDVAAMRVNYTANELLEEECHSDPFVQFGRWFEEAVAEGVPEPNAMSLSTVSGTSQPSARMVLLKGVDPRGFVWYTNYDSRKAHELETEPCRAALVFWWHGLQRQVRVEGPVSRVSPEESDEYFHSRPRGSQLGAAASPQSSVINGRDVLDEMYRQLAEEKYPPGASIPRPANWGGFRLQPERIEFWQGRQSRLHDRLLFTRDTPTSESWQRERLAP
eukprot:TRINITY_DN10989_c0_g2_i1.p1 TRINITY_DN10989_c0_g2~~TRINITY_DN10989_c0_g2_i1.p1  ORF type:complete len:249 (+),score=33.48 TRINITY_DN10989_c0_g2_i1:59-748(+)